jgi:hypothetical protein
VRLKCGHTRVIRATDDPDKPYICITCDPTRSTKIELEKPVPPPPWTRSKSRRKST